MKDINAKISELLSDPDGMERIRKMAESVFGDNKKQPEPALPAIPDFDMTKLVPLLSRLNSRGTDNRTALLLALRPHLSRKRQERLDKAVKLLKVADMLPLLQESGIFNL